MEIKISQSQYSAMLDWEGNMMEERYRSKRRKLDENLYEVISFLNQALTIL